MVTKHAPEQLVLRLSSSAEDQRRAVLARGFYCMHLRATISRAQCHAAQLEEPPQARGAARRKNERGAVQGGAKWGTRSPSAAYCRSGACEQGKGVLAEDGMLQRRLCPCCRGRRWVPDVDVPATERVG
jgi:hypothetical protein